MNIKQITFSKNQYYQEEVTKSQIYIHHTAGNSDAVNVFRDWETNDEKIATCAVISGIGKNCIDGEIVQGFSSKYWAYHLGVKKSVFSQLGLPYVSLDKISIGIEICNWGQLTKKDNKFYNYVNREVTDVCELSTPHKGYKFYHNYTDAQIESVRELLISWKQKYNIPLDYNEDIWGITNRALTGKSGIFTHNSVRHDKVDCYPHPKLVAMLKDLQ